MFFCLYLEVSGNCIVTQNCEYGMKWCNFWLKVRQGQEFKSLEESCEIAPKNNNFGKHENSDIIQKSSWPHCVISKKNWMNNWV